MARQYSLEPVDIDVTFDFTTGTRGYWDGFWDGGPYGRGGSDPDRHSETMRRYNREIWSRTLPCGKRMDLSINGHVYIWEGHRLSNDSITTCFRHPLGRPVIDVVVKELGDGYKSFMEDYVRRTYTAGGSIVLPIPDRIPGEPRVQSINQARGISHMIRDRWDLTLECIRLYYDGEVSPLYGSINACSWFFDPFVDFRGYVDYFLLQDLVDPDYGAVRTWRDDSLGSDPLPADFDEYMDWIGRQIGFAESRGRRIADMLSRRTD